MEKRNIYIGVYRYGFNGKEKDDEVSGDGNIIAFEARIFDARLGRFFSVDPLEKKYSFQSPYVFAHNNPIVLIDFMGMGDPPKHGDSREAGTSENKSTEYWDEYAGGAGGGAWVDNKPKSFSRAEICKLEDYANQSHQCYTDKDCESGDDECITSFNRGQALVHNDPNLSLPDQMVSWGQVKGAGQVLQNKGLAETPFSIDYTVDPNTQLPVANSDPTNTILANTPQQPGIYIMGVGLGYGFHVMTLVIDKTDVNNIVIYSADPNKGYVNRTTPNTAQGVDALNTVLATYTNLAVGSYSNKLDIKKSEVKAPINSVIWLIKP